MDNDMLKERHGIFGNTDNSIENMRRVSVDYYGYDKQGVCRAQSISHAPPGRNNRPGWDIPGVTRAHSRQPCSVPVREHFVPDTHKKNSLQSNSPFQHSISPCYSKSPPSHPTLALARSLPFTSTQGKKGADKPKLCRTGDGRGSSLNYESRVKRKSVVWGGNLGQNKECTMDSERNFQFDDEISLKSEESNPEDHIYEEIDSDLFTSCDEEEPAENFLLGISLERRNNLKFYGSAGWDFGN